jgi:hypothetical protein
MSAGHDGGGEGVAPNSLPPGPTKYLTNSSRMVITAQHVIQALERRRKVWYLVRFGGNDGGTGGTVAGGIVVMKWWMLSSMGGF